MVARRSPPRHHDHVLTPPLAPALLLYLLQFLSTFIDDLFAFVVKMPTLHRLAVFRDDLIFFIYLYQRWIYPVDKTRVNEFGFSGEDADAAAAGKRPGGPVAAASPAAPAIAAGVAGPKRSKFDRAPAAGR